MRTGSIWTGIVFIIFGVLVLVLPDLIRWLIGIALIAGGILALVKR